jgi:hypothetical protein
MASADYNESDISFKKGRYSVIKEIGEGSFGRVYLAFDTTLKDRYDLPIFN